MTNCDHKTKVLEWGYDLTDGKMNSKVELYGCTDCDATSKVPFPSSEVFIDHSNCSEDPCFGCKARFLQLSVGDARHDGVMSAKQHDKELGSYFDAVRQGIEPVSTRTKDIQAAVRLSNDTGKAFDANKI